ncbi:hypothetical protein EDD66_110128 [Mobilisporobacter senegalensis]|uniref:Uncharacterized protein n=1 Tax=Mobilisporobacter senegalensis TaxID=1329262 RepID=A0A3N1XI07_9FIRM|nr:hypothetical protein [Mobilisporobacter senegalensis]ROR25771.1 hypothetical protein EDD66_110128 [Mobilisporobacter senegalensis]
MTNFESLYNCISKQVLMGETHLLNGIEVQVYSTSNPFTALIYSNRRPLMKLQRDNSGIFTLFFQKKDIPYEIGYTGYLFHKTDPIDKLLAKDILNEYPIAKEVYEHLITLLNEREDKQND